jgi:hypothetical protein
MNSEHWLIKFKICIITTAWRQRNSKHFLIDDFLQKQYISFLQDFVNSKSFLRKKDERIGYKKGAKAPTLTKVSLF